MYDNFDDPIETWPSATINTLPPETKRQFEEMHQALSCRPPVRRNWTPLVYAAAVAVIGVMLWAIVVALA